MVIFDQSTWLGSFGKIKDYGVAVILAIAAATQIYGFFDGSVALIIAGFALFMPGVPLWQTVGLRAVKRLMLSRKCANLRSVLGDNAWCLVEFFPDADSFQRRVFMHGRELTEGVIAHDSGGLRRLEEIQRIEILDDGKAAQYLKSEGWYFVAVYKGAEFSKCDVLAQGRDLKEEIIPPTADGLRNLGKIRSIEVLDIRDAAHYAALEERLAVTGEFVWENPEDTPDAFAARAYQQTQELGALLDQADRYWSTIDLSGLPDGVRERVMTRIAVRNCTPLPPMDDADLENLQYPPDASS